MRIGRGLIASKYKLPLDSPERAVTAAAHADAPFAIAGVECELGRLGAERASCSERDAPGRRLSAAEACYCPQSQLPKATRSVMQVFGIDWDDTTGTRHGHFALCLGRLIDLFGHWQRHCRGCVRGFGDVKAGSSKSLPSVDGTTTQFLLDGEQSCADIAERDVREPLTRAHKRVACQTPA